MKNITIIALLLILFLSNFLTAKTIDKNPNIPFDVRGWILLVDDMEYARQVIDKAPLFGINHIQISHNLIHHADEVLSDAGKREKLITLTNWAHEKGLECFVWTHEIREPDPKWLNANGKLSFTEEELKTFLVKRYNLFFDLCPDVDGLVISFSEGDFSVSEKDIEKQHFQIEHIYQVMITTIYNICQERGKELYVRKFADEAEPVIRQLPDSLVVMQKCTKEDWHVYSPNNPILGTFAPKKQICEFDLAGEYTGQGLIPWCALPDLQARFRFAIGRGCTGMVARIDRDSYSAFGTPNEINIHFFSELLKNPNADLDDFWHAWCKKRFGRKAAKAAEEALRQTYELTNRLFWGDKLMDWRIQKHSKIPDLRYAISHDKKSFMYTPPTDVNLFAIPGMIDSEMNRRYGMLANDVDIVIARLEKNRRKFKKEDYDWIHIYLKRLRFGVDAFHSVHDSFIRLKVIEEKGTAPERIKYLKDSLNQLDEIADIVDKEIQPPIALYNSALMKRFAYEIKAYLKSKNVDLDK